MPPGLPTYTLPPAEPATAIGPPHAAEPATAIRPPHAAQPAAAIRPPHGVGAPGEPHWPFGGSVPDPRRAAPARRRDHEPEPRRQAPEPDLQSALAGSSPIDMTMPISMNAVENSGSLTGHILSQGWDLGDDTTRYSKAKVNIVLLLVLLALIGVSVLFLLTTGSAVSDLIHGASPP